MSALPRRRAAFRNIKADSLTQQAKIDALKAKGPGNDKQIKKLEEGMLKVQANLFIFRFQTMVSPADNHRETPRYAPRAWPGSMECAAQNAVRHCHVQGARRIRCLLHALTGLCVPADHSARASLEYVAYLVK